MLTTGNPIFDSDMSSVSHERSPCDLHTYAEMTKKFGNHLTKAQKPKRNRSAFIIFSSEMRSKIRVEEKKKLNSNEIMVKLADMWRNISDEERKKFTEIAEKEKIRYLLELNEFYQTHPFDVIENKTKKNHIKKPCSAYGLFLRETKTRVKSEQPNLKMADVLKVVAERWKKLSETERSIYQNQAKTEKDAQMAKVGELSNTNNKDEFYQMSLPQKRLQSQKRVKKALLRQNLKTQCPTTPSENLCDETPALTEDNFALGASETNESETENFLNDAICIEEPQLNKMPSFTFNYTPFSFEINNQQVVQQMIEEPQNRLAQLGPIDPLMKKSSTDFLMDLLNFKSNYDPKYSLMNSFKESFTMAGTQANCAKGNSRRALQDALVNTLETDNMFSSGIDFDSFTF